MVSNVCIACTGTTLSKLYLDAQTFCINELFIFHFVAKKGKKRMIQNWQFKTHLPNLHIVQRFFKLYNFMYIMICVTQFAFPILHNW